MTDTRACPGHECGAHLRETECLCRRCVNRAERILGDLVAETTDLEVTISRQARISNGGHRKKGDTLPLPVNLKAADDGDTALALLFEWADFIAQWHHEKGMPIRTTGVDKRVELVTQAVGIIHRHINWLGSNEQGPECASAIWHVRRNLRRITDRPIERTYAGPCHAPLPAVVTAEDGTITVALTDPRKAPKCERGLYRQWGSVSISCDGYGDPEQAHLPPSQRQGCGAEHPVTERATFLRDSVAEQWLPLRLVWESLYVLLPGCQVTWETARKWARGRDIRTVDATGRGHIKKIPPRLAARSATKDGVKLYRGADILTLARDEQPRAGRRRTRTRHGKATA